MEKELAHDKTQKTILDPFQVWKKLYFSAEETMTSTARKSVNTGEFANSIDFILNSYLQYLRMQNEFLSRYMKDSPFASKYDVARVAELVVSLENKLDRLEVDFEQKLSNVENNTQYMAEHLAAQPKMDATEAFSKVLSPTVATLNQISQRMDALETLIRQLDTNLTENKRPGNLAASKQTVAPPVGNTKKSTAKTKTTE